MRNKLAIAIIVLGLITSVLVIMYVIMKFFDELRRISTPLVTLIFAIVVSAIGGIFVKILSWLTRRAAKKISTPIRETILQKDCKACNARGFVTCEECKGTGSIPKEVSYVGRCSSCDGTGLTKTTCPTCYGAKVVKRTLFFDVLESTTRVDGILLWPRTQTVTIKVRNLDSIAGKFTAQVILHDPSQTKRIGHKVVAPGNVKDIKVVFPADKWEGYASSYDVQPEIVSFPCSNCQGIGSIPRTCITCNGTGKMTTKVQQVEVCPICGGHKEVRCKECSGTGKIGRFT